MRGKGDEFNVFRSINGITPAHAGKSAQIFRPCGEQWDHPRTCGEKEGKILPGNANAGSPPHMRGKVPADVVFPANGGITPAHAGKRAREGQAGFPYRDHPRTCGEKQLLNARTSRVAGSPPHMRGKDSGSNEI